MKPRPSSTDDPVLSAILESITHQKSVTGLIEDIELNLGATLIPLGANSPINFSTDDWEHGIISRLGDEIRLVAIQAKQPGNGAFSRLVKHIQQQGFVPVVVEPIGEVMPAIMKKWEWQHKTATHNTERWRWEEWRPVPAWYIKSRITKNVS